MLRGLVNRFREMRQDDSVRLARYLPRGERSGRVLVAGDLHGEYQTLMRALQALSFDRDRDRLLLLGDIHDRGRSSEECLDLLSQPWVESVLGNHELMLVESVATDGSLRGGALDLWMANGGEWVLDASPRRRAGWRRLLLDKLPLNWVVERRDGRRVLVCHAEPDPEWLDRVLALDEGRLPLNAFRGSVTLWGRRILGVAADETLARREKERLLRPLGGVLCSVHGHTQLAGAGWVNNQLFADTGAVFGNRLTLVDLDHLIPGRANGIHAWEIASQRLLGYAAGTIFSAGRDASAFHYL